MSKVSDEESAAFALETVERAYAVFKGDSVRAIGSLLGVAAGIAQRSGISNERLLNWLAKAVSQDLRDGDKPS